MRVGSLVQNRHWVGDGFGVVLEIGYSNGEEWALVHWCVEVELGERVLDGTLDPYQYIHDLEVICE